MHLSLLAIVSSFVTFGNKDAYCGSVPQICDGYKYVTCRGNFTEIESLKLSLKNISSSVGVFMLQDAFMDVLPSDMFHDIPNPNVHKVILNNVSIDLLNVPELGNPPLTSIKDTVESLEIYSCSKVFGWDFPSLELENLKNIIIEDTELISVTMPFFFWPELRLIQIQSSSLRWIHHTAFQMNKKLTIFSLAHNKVSHICRSMFPKPAATLYSMDLSFNRLEYLTYDIFTEMNALQELKLDSNRLKFVSHEHLKQVWNNLEFLWLDGNEIDCASVCWMSKRTEIPHFFDSSKCKISNVFIFLSKYLKLCESQVKRSFSE